MSINLNATFGKESRAKLECTRISQDESRNRPCPQGTYKLYDILAFRAGGPIPEPPIADDVFTTVLIIQTPNLSDIELTYGEIIKKEIITKNLTEPVSIVPNDYPEFDMSSKLEFIPDSVNQKIWQGKVFDEDGNQITNPTVTCLNNLCTISRSCFGTLQVSYTCTVYEITVRIPPRTTEPSDNYDSHIFIVNDCIDEGILDFEITVPVCFQDNFNNVNNKWPWDEGQGDATVTGPKSKGQDASFSWEFCSPHTLKSQSPDIYIDGCVYPGTLK